MLLFFDIYLHSPTGSAPVHPFPWSCQGSSDCRTSSDLCKVHPAPWLGQQKIPAGPGEPSCLLECGSCWAPHHSGTNPVLLGQPFPLLPLQATCERGFAAMEETHQKKIEDLQRQHQRELEKLREEKDRLLAEETAATISGARESPRVDGGDMGVVVAALRSRAGVGMGAEWAAQGAGMGLWERCFRWRSISWPSRFGAHLLVLHQAWYPCLWLLHSVICFLFQLRKALVIPVVKLLPIPH